MADAKKQEKAKKVTVVDKFKPESVNIGPDGMTMSGTVEAAHEEEIPDDPAVAGSAVPPGSEQEVIDRCVDAEDKFEKAQAAITHLEAQHDQLNQINMDLIKVRDRLKHESEAFAQKVTKKDGMIDDLLKEHPQIHKLLRAKLEAIRNV